MEYDVILHLFRYYCLYHIHTFLLNVVYTSVVKKGGQYALINVLKTYP